MKRARPYYPVFLDLVDRPCLVVGAGRVAVEKVAGLLEAGARVTVVAPEADARIRRRHRDGRVHWKQRRFRSGDVDGAFIVVAATNDPKVNQRVFDAARSQERPINAADDAARCTFILPARARAGVVQAAVSTSGASPALAQRLRDRIQRELLAPPTAKLADFLAKRRERVKARLPTYELRERFWRRWLDSPNSTLVAADERAAEAAFAAMLERAAASPARERARP
jgi:siroheme synthase-like protein